MRSKRVGFWTQERLAELEKLFPTSTPAKLKTHFGLPLIAIVEAHEFIQRSRPLVENIVVENGIRVTIYKPAFAEGVAKQVVGGRTYTAWNDL